MSLSPIGLLASFGAGILSFLAPCVVPLPRAGRHRLHRHLDRVVTRQADPLVVLYPGQSLCPFEVHCCQLARVQAQQVQ
jgi:hypothetical protein